MSTLAVTIGEGDVVLMTLDSLRYDVAILAFRSQRTPFLAKMIGQAWEERHSPGSFTYAAHAALFAGFWPTPAAPGRHARPFALRFAGSRSIDRATCILDGATIVEGFRNWGYYTLCVGGVGFFNKLNPLGSFFPSLFDESHWRPEFGVAELHSTRHQVACAVATLGRLPQDRPVFLFLNVAAMHPPTHMYLPGACGDSIESQTAALEYVDGELPPLFEALRKRRRPGSAYLMSDHGTAFGEDGYRGHRIGHPVVWTVPYAECHWGANG